MRQLALEAQQTIDTEMAQSPAGKVRAISQVISARGIKPARDEDYYAVENSLIHLVLQGRGSLPITMAIIFTAVAKECGLNAAPINYVRAD